MAEAQKLTKRTVDSIKHPKEGQQFYWDRELPGFGLRVTPGSKSYIVQDRVAGRTVRATIGPHGTFTPEEARNEAKAKLGDLSRGIDLIHVARKQEAHGVTLREAYDAYIASRALAENTLRDYKKAMDSAFNDWQAKPIRDINRAMIERRFELLSKASSAQANQAFRFLRALLNYAMEKYTAEDGEPLIPSNPCNRLTTLKRWHRIAGRTSHIEPEKLKPWFAALDHDPEDSKQRNAVRDLCALLILTGLREQEGASLAWVDVDLDAKRITVRHTKNHLTHVLPIGKWLAGRLTTRKAEAGPGATFVFPAENKAGHLKNHRKDVLALCEQSGVQFRLHDLRRSFASIVNHHLSRHISAYTLKRLLNHSNNGGDVTAGYVQIGVEDLRSPMEAVEVFVLKHAGINPSSKVVSMKKRMSA
jgi:integrase